MSSILLSGSYCSPDNPVRLCLSDAPVSEPYIDMTTTLMAEFGVKVQKSPNEWQYEIPAGGYINPQVNVRVYSPDP